MTSRTTATHGLGAAGEQQRDLVPGRAGQGLEEIERSVSELVENDKPEADQVVDARTTDPADAIQAVGGAGVVVALAAAPKPFEQAFRSLHRGGRLVMVALPGDNATLPVPIFETVLGGISVIGSIVGTRQDVAEVFALHAAGRTEVICEKRTLDQVNEGVAEILSARVPARVVFEF